MKMMVTSVLSIKFFFSNRTNRHRKLNWNSTTLSATARISPTKAAVLSLRWCETEKVIEYYQVRVNTAHTST